MSESKKEGKSFLKTYLKGEATIAGWSVAANIMALANTALLLAHLDLFQYGLFILLFAFYAMATGIFLQPLQDMIVNDISRYTGSGREEDAKKLYREMFVLRMGTALFLMVAVFIGAEFVAEWYHEDIANLVRILAILFPIDAAYVMMRTLFEVRLRFDLSSSRGVISKMIRFILLVGTIFFFDLTVSTAVIVSILTSLIVLPLFFREYRTLYRSWSAIPASTGSFLLPLFKAHGKWPLVGQVVSELISNARPWLIKAFTTTEAVALFSVAESLYGMTKRLVPAQTLSMLVPRHIGDAEKMRRIFIMGIKYMTLGEIAAGIVGFFAAPIGLRLFFPQYEPVIMLYWVLLLTLPFAGLRTVSGLYLVTYRNQKFLFFLVILKSTLHIIIPLALLPVLGVVGMSIERVVTTMALAFLAYDHVRRHNVGAFHAKQFFLWDDEDRKFFMRVFREVKSLVAGAISKLSFARL